MSLHVEDQDIETGSSEMMVSAPLKDKAAHDQRISSVKKVATPSTLDNSKSIDEEQLLPKSRWKTFKAHLIQLRPLFTMLFINVGLSLAIYYVAKQWVSVLVALILSGIPPLLRVIYVVWKRRKVDILGCIVIFSFIISAVVSVVTGDARLTLLRDSATTAIISVLFFFTLIPLQTRWFRIRPLVFLVYSQMVENLDAKKWTDAEGQPHQLGLADWVWLNFPIFRAYCYTLSALWGILLMGEFIAKVIMIEASQLDIDHILLYSQIIVIVVTVTMTVGTVITSRYITNRIRIEAKKWELENDFTDRRDE